MESKAKQLAQKDVESAQIIRDGAMNGKKTYGVDESRCNDDCTIGDLITMEISNKNETERRTLIFGTQLGTTDAPKIKTLWESIPASKRPLVQDTKEVTVTAPTYSLIDEGSGVYRLEEDEVGRDLHDEVFVGYKFRDDLEDQFGPNMPFLEMLNKRLVSRGMMVKSIEVITDNDAQRKISPQKLSVPLNFEDGRFRRSPSMGVYTDYNETELLKKPRSFGMFGGWSLDILPDTDIALNIHVSAVDNMTFKS